MSGILRRAVIAITILALPIATASPAVAVGGRHAARQSTGADTGLFYTGNAYGTYAFVGSTLVAGKSALVSLGCATTAGVHQRNEIAHVGVPGVLSTGVIESRAATSDSGDTQTSRTSSEVHDADVLSGLITADEIKAASATSHSGNGFRTSAGGSQFLNLVVDGRPISAHVAPNTKIRLPGVGRVVLNEHKRTVGADSASFTVNMIHVYVTHDLSGVAKGTQIVVAHATSDLELNKAGSLDGMAFGSAAHVGHTVISGRTALVRMPCAGTHGNVRMNSVASVTLPGIGTTGTVTDTAQGSIDATTASSETTSTVQGVTAFRSGHRRRHRRRCPCLEDGWGRVAERRGFALREPGGERPGDRRQRRGEHQDQGRRTHDLAAPGPSGLEQHRGPDDRDRGQAVQPVRAPDRDGRADSGRRGFRALARRDALTALLGPGGRTGPPGGSTSRRSRSEHPLVTDHDSRRYPDEVRPAARFDPTRQARVAPAAATSHTRTPQ